MSTPPIDAAESPLNGDAQRVATVGWTATSFVGANVTGTVAAGVCSRSTCPSNVNAADLVADEDAARCRGARRRRCR